MEKSLYNKKENTKSVQSCLKDHDMYKHKNYYRAQIGRSRALVLSSVTGVWNIYLPVLILKNGCFESRVYSWKLEEKVQPFSD